MKSKLLAACVLLLASACQSVAPAPEEASSHDWVFMQLKSGPMASQATKEVFEGHMANIHRLAAAGQLLVAGPYAAPKRDPELAGVFVLATPDIDAAQELAATDPGVIAGVFRTESVRMRTRAPLDVFLEQYLAEEAQAKARGESGAPGGMRTYVWLTAEHGRRARQALLEVPGILLWADLADGRALALFDAQDTTACTDMLGEQASAIGPYLLDPWKASARLVGLPELARQAKAHAN